MEAPNALAGSTTDLEEWKPYLDELTALTTTTPAPPTALSSTSTLPEQLAALAQLHSGGVLTDEEFTTAKSRLLELD